MSCLTKSRYLSNNDKEKFYLADDDGNDDFDFQYVPVNQFKHIIKDVRRQRIRNEEERVWTSFVKGQEQSVPSHQQSCTTPEHKHKSIRALEESLEEVDRELMRLEADNLPETHIQITNNNTGDSQEKINSAKSTKKDLQITKEDGTGSTNLLLTIPEEEHVYCTTESSESHKQRTTYIRKSCSDQTFKNNRIHSRCYHYSTNDMDYNNSSPDISPDRLSNENNSIPVHPDPVAVTKILGIQRKISSVLNSISYELDRIPLPDGENDLMRRQQRVVEFSTRLSRNYLYDLGRQISDIQSHINAINSSGKIRISRRGIIFHMQVIEQKLISAHQLLLTALSAYWKHIPCSVLKNHPGKLKEILQVVVQLKNICTEIKLTPDFYCSGDERDAFLGKETENRCSAILSKFRLISDNESQVPSHTTRSTIATPSRSKKQRNRKITNRLSMYAMDMKLAKSYQPKKTHSMFQIPRNKKYNYTGLKPQQSSILPVTKKRLPPFPKTSSEVNGNKTTKIRIPLKEDDIQTMMETVPSDLDLESPGSIKSAKKCEIYEKSYKTTEIYENTKESARLNRNRVNSSEEMIKGDNTREKCFSSLLPVIGDLLSLVHHKENNSKSMPAIDTLYNFLQKCQPNEDSNESQIHAGDEIEIGTKNMRLICCSAKEDDEGKRKFLEIEENNEIIKFNDASCQANYLTKNNGSSKLMVSESATLCLRDYRNQYHSLLKSNPMYTSNTQNKPWEVVAWIADKLVDELIVEVSNDLQMDGVIQKLFDLEFQEF